LGRTSGPLHAPQRENESQQFNSDSEELDRLLGGVLLDGDGEPIVSTSETVTKTAKKLTMSFASTEQQ